MQQRTKEENHDLDQMNCKADSVFMLIYNKKIERKRKTLLSSRALSNLLNQNHCEEEYKINSFLIRRVYRSRIKSGKIYAQMLLS